MVMKKIEGVVIFFFLCFVILLVCIATLLFLGWFGQLGPGMAEAWFDFGWLDHGNKAPSETIEENS